MKKKFPLIGVYLGMLLLLCIGLSVTCTSCKEKPSFFSNDDIESSNDSILVAQYIDRVANPEFLTVKEIFDFRGKMVENAQIDSLIISLPENVLMNVSTVVLNKFGTATKKELYDEYRANIEVYTNLPQSSSENKPDTAPKSEANKTPTQMEDATTRVVTEGPKESVISYNFKDSVINGKKAKVETKIITYE
jgi:hypothetical protein